MVKGTWTATPIARSDEHKSTHHFTRTGLCLYCGWSCDECNDLKIATCKCDGSQARADYRLEQENSGTTDDWK
jgi:hypothetical protein